MSRNKRIINTKTRGSVPNDVEEIEELKNQTCPMCGKNTLTLTQLKRDIPYFGVVFIYSMSCSNCKFHKSDVEVAERNDPVKYSIEVQGEDDLKIRIVKSSEATIKIPRIVEITPGPASNGYITNVEGLLNRIKDRFEAQKEVEEDNNKKKEYLKLIKKLNRVLWGKEKLRIIIEDPSGNSAIVSEKAKVEKLKVKKK